MHLDAIAERMCAINRLLWNSFLPEHYVVFRRKYYPCVTDAFESFIQSLSRETKLTSILRQVYYKLMDIYNVSILVIHLKTVMWMIFDVAIPSIMIFWSSKSNRMHTRPTLRCAPSVFGGQRGNYKCLTITPDGATVCAVLWETLRVTWFY